MRYSYSAAWSVIGGISLPNDSEPIELCNSQGCRFVLTRDPDSLLANVERGTAIARLMLKGLIGQQKAATFPIALETEIAEIKEERKKQTGTYPVLVIEAQGEVKSSIVKPMLELEDFIVTFDAVNGEAVRRNHRSEIDAMKLAVSFESEVPSRFSMLNEGTYLFNETGKIVYSINFSGSLEGVVQETCQRRDMGEYLHVTPCFSSQVTLTRYKDYSHKWPMLEQTDLRRSSPVGPL